MITSFRLSNSELEHYPLGYCRRLKRSLLSRGKYLQESFVLHLTWLLCICMALRTTTVTKFCNNMQLQQFFMKPDILNVYHLMSRKICLFIYFICNSSEIEYGEWVQVKQQTMYILFCLQIYAIFNSTLSSLPGGLSKRAKRRKNIYQLLDYRWFVKYVQGTTYENHVESAKINIKTNTCTKTKQNHFIFKYIIIWWKV